MQIALATARPRPEISADHDLPLLREAVESSDPHVRATVAGWDDPAIDWSVFDLVVIRSTWDYTWRREEFCAGPSIVPL